MKKVLKFQFEGKEGFLSVAEKDGKYFALVQKETPKVASIEKKHLLSISYELKTPVYREVPVKVSYDPTIIAWVYNQLEKDNNLYFKQLDDTLCALEIEK